MHFPKGILPMQSQDTQAPFNDNCYLFEQVRHGQRALLFLLDTHWYFQDATGQPMHTPDAHFLVFEHFPKGIVCDGVLVSDKAGLDKPRFIAFDALYFCWRNVMHEPLINRRMMLEDRLSDKKDAAFELNPWAWCHGKAAARELAQHGADAMMAKHIYSDYVAGNPSPSWLKIALQPVAVRAPDAHPHSLVY